ncbi:hypothetical protein EDC04DRAFT_2609235 [Pisolithus marmoratus]|nr:hypothetical protein EDC04DRAFT_2609235 [Pisolithus marmoratus]
MQWQWLMHSITRCEAMLYSLQVPRPKVVTRMADAIVIPISKPFGWVPKCKADDNAIELPAKRSVARSFSINHDMLPESKPLLVSFGLSQVCKLLQDVSSHCYLAAVGFKLPIVGWLDVNEAGCVALPVWRHIAFRVVDIMWFTSSRMLSQHQLSAMCAFFDSLQDTQVHPDQDDEENIIKYILEVTDKRKEETDEGEDAREEKTRPTKAGDYKKPFPAFTSRQRLFKGEIDSYDRERRDTKDPKTIGQRTKIIQLGGLLKNVINWVHLRRLMIHSYQRKNFPGMAREFIDMVHRTMGSHIVMFAAHEAQDSQIKMAVHLVLTPPQDGKKAFSEASEPSKDWVLKGEQTLTDYLLTDPVEEELNEEKKDAEITLDDDGNPEIPPWTGIWLEQSSRQPMQSLHRSQKPRFHGACLHIKCPLEYLDSKSIPDGFVMKDPSKWTKADMRLLCIHWHSLVDKYKVIVTFIKCRKDDVSLGRFLDGKARSKKRVWVNIDDDSEVEAGAEDSEAETSGRGKTLKKLLELVVALPETETHVSTEAALPEWALWTWGAKYLPENIHLDGDSFLKALDQLEGEKFGSCLQGGPVVLGLGLLLRECSQAQEVEEDDPEVSHLDFLLNSNLGIQRGRMFCVQWGMNQEEVDDHLEERTASVGGDEEEEAPIQAPWNKRKRKESKNTQEKAEILEDGRRRECISMFNTVKKLSTLKEAPFMIIPHVGQPHIQETIYIERDTFHDYPPAMLADPTSSHVSQPNIQVSTGWEYLTSGDSPHHGWGISRAAIQ